MANPASPCWQLHGQDADGSPPQARLFRKRLPAAQLPRLEAEVEGLAALAPVAGELVLPRVLGWGLVAGGTQAELRLEWLDLGGDGPDGWAALGEGLAQMHRRARGAAFGWQGDRFIGAGPQLGGWSENWGQFFAERRLAPQFSLAAHQGLHWPGSGALLKRVPLWLNGHGAEPVLVHGDLWAGNAGVIGDGRGCLFDPAVSYSDREVDLAMAQLFGGFPRHFLMPTKSNGRYRQGTGSGGMFTTSSICLTTPTSLAVLTSRSAAG